VRKVTDKQKANLKPFKPNNPETGEKDERINRAGRAKSFDELRALFQEIANEETSTKDRRSKIRRIGEMMANDKRQFKDFLEFAYGKVPNDTNLNLRGEITWKEFIEGSSSKEKKDDT
jgi:hypothetical protein